MKKLILLTAISFIWMSAILPLNASAADITVGATTWYAWWDMNRSGSNGNATEFDPAFLYGPMLSIKFNDDYNLTFVYLYGKFDMNEPDGTTSEIARNDSDLALNYRLNNFFKIFAGAKYMSYSIKNDMDHIGIGPGAGISAVFPVGGDFFILGNISGLYLWGEEKYKGSSTNSDAKYNEYGSNASLSLAYYIVPASTTISLGGRYQIFKTMYESSSTNDDMQHKFYGVTLSANYSFSI